MIKSPDFSNTNTQQTNLYDQIDLSTTTSIHCEECEGKAFKQTLLLRRLSSIISPTGKEIVIPEDPRQEVINILDTDYDLIVK